MYQTAYLATGCFWGAERRFWQLVGVVSTSVGYMGGITKNPTYQEVCSGATNHAEMVEVTFDPSLISFKDLLAEFWVMHDPTSLNRQGGDIGTQYRSAIYTTSKEQMLLALKSKDVYQSELVKNCLGAIVTQILPADGVTYWLAEDYHQRYLQKNPNGYDCHSSTGIAFPLKGGI
jgi:peptide-methionine (S)-S-oxide reductase